MRSRRKDLEDDVFTMSRKLADTTSLCNSNTKAIAWVMQVLGAEGEHKDQVRILIVKKRTMTMRQFYGHFNSFQAHFQSNTGTLQITSAGPVWQVEVRSPAATQAIRDSVIAWIQSQSMQVTVIRGKSSISQARERICTGTAEAISSTFGIEKGKGKGKGSPQRLSIHWPNNRNQWKIFADGQLVVAGEIDMTKQVYIITLAANSLNGKHQELGHAIREWEKSDRVGYMLAVVINITPTLVGYEEWGRAPRGNFTPLVPIGHAATTFGSVTQHIAQQAAAPTFAPPTAPAILPTMPVGAASSVAGSYNFGTAAVTPIGSGLLITEAPSIVAKKKALAAQAALATAQRVAEAAALEAQSLASAALAAGHE